jgi:hypothetical protein
LKVPLGRIGLKVRVRTIAARIRPGITRLHVRIPGDAVRLAILSRARMNCVSIHHIVQRQKK